MELQGLDENFRLLGYVPYLSLQWKRKYYEAGSFEFQIRQEDYLPGLAYVFAADRPEVGALQKLRTQNKVNGDFVLASGFFCEKLLDRNVFYPKLSMTGTPSAIAQKALADYPPDGVSITHVATSMGTSTSVEWLGQDVGKELYSLLKTQEMSQRVYFDFMEDKLKYKLWKGVDRTQSQNTNPWALFTDESAYVTGFEITEDDSDYRNYAHVLYGDEEAPTLMDIDLRKSAGEPKRKLFIEKYGVDQVIDEVKQEATERLQEYAKIESADIKVIQDGLFYLQDYDLGDKCDVINHKLQKSYETRLIGVTEAFERGKHIVSLEFGEKVPTDYNKLNRLVRTMRR